MIADALQTLSPMLLTTLVVAVIVLFIALVGFIFVLKSRITAAENATAKANEKVSSAIKQIDNSINGVLQLNATDNILYANQVAAYYLGKKKDQLVGKALGQVCPKKIREAVNDLLAQGKDASLECQLGFHNRYTRLRIARHKKPLGEITATVIIDDISHFHDQIEYQETRYSRREKAMEHAAVYMATLDIDQDQLTLNGPLAKVFGTEMDEPTSVEAFGLFVDSNNYADWERLIRLIKEGKPQSFESFFQTKQLRIPFKIEALPHTNDKDDVVSATLVFENQFQLQKYKDQATSYHQQLKSIMTSSPIPLYVLNNKGQLIDCNAKFCTMFGIDRHKVRNKRIEDIDFYDDYFKAIHAGLDGFVATQKSALVSVSDSKQIEINIHFKSFAAGTDNAGIIGLIEDQTQSRQMQLELASLAETLNSVIEQAPLGIAIFADNNQIKRVNDSLASQLGVERSVLEQQSFPSLFSSEEQAESAKRQLQTKGQLESLQTELIRADGQPYSTQIDAMRLEGSTNDFICWVTDSQDFQYVEHQLERLTTFSNIPIGILVDNAFTKLNPAACAFFNVLTEDELIGQSPASDNLNTSYESAEDMQKHIQRLKHNKEVAQFSWIHQHKGETLPCEVTLIPLFKQGAHVATLCIWVDLRALEQANAARLEAVRLRKAAEEEIAEQQLLLESNQDLLESRALSLRDTKEKLEATESTLASKLDTIKNLQKSNEDISGHLDALQSDYDENRELLAQSQKTNTELEAQLEESSEKVSFLEVQRNQIADALQYSERKHRKAQEKLAQSEQSTEMLKEAQATQLASLQDSQKQIDSLKHSIESKDKKIKDVSGQITSLQSQLTSSGQASEKLREQLANQRKASEIAEQKRRELEDNCKDAQLQLSNKSSYVEHLQHEMAMLEKMSQQQKGDMEKQTQQLEQELEAKQNQLASTKQQLEAAQQQSEQEKQENSQRAAQMEQLQKELQEVEQRSVDQQLKISESEKHWQSQQAALQSELTNKQLEIQQVNDKLQNKKAQSIDQREAQRARVKELEAELEDVIKRTTEQELHFALSDQKQQKQQKALADELANKKAQLEEKQHQIDEHHRQMEAERFERKAQQEKLAQLQLEMADVESRATKQRELVSGDAEQWRQQHAEIEKQKQQLQQALEFAENQNKTMQSSLENNLQALQKAEETVSKTQSDEQRLQQELSDAKQQADKLFTKLIQQEDQEKELKQQVFEQQSNLQQREESIQALQDEQQRLTDALQAMKDEYAQSKASIRSQSRSQRRLNDQLKQLESELKNSKQQLNDKEQALQEAQQQIASSAGKLAAQEKALIETQQAEFKQSTDGQSTAKQADPEYAKLPMPDDPNSLFDLIPYLQQHKGITSLASTLQALLDSLHREIVSLDTAVSEDNERGMKLAARNLAKVLTNIQSEPLQDMAAKLQVWCENHMIDNISISWPTSKDVLMSTLRVIHSHLHAQNTVEQPD